MIKGVFKALIGAMAVFATLSVPGIVKASETATTDVHSYGQPVFVWNDEDHSCKAQFKCSCGDVESVDCAVDTVVSSKATFEKNGKIKCTPKVFFMGAEYRGKAKKYTIYKIKSVSLKKTYSAYTGNKNKPTIKVTDSKGNKISSKLYSVTYRYNGKKSTPLEAGRYNVSISFKTQYSGSKILTYHISKGLITPKSPVLSRVSDTSINVEWDKSEGASGYQLEYSKLSYYEDTTPVVITITGGNTINKKLKNLDAAPYKVRLRSYVALDGKKAYSPWSEATVNGHFIEYELNGGINSDENPIWYHEGSDILLKEPVREGFEFDGWYMKSPYDSQVSTGEGEVYADQGIKVEHIKGTEISGNITLCATWKPVLADEITNEEPSGDDLSGGETVSEGANIDENDIVASIDKLCNIMCGKYFTTTGEPGTSNTDFVTKNISVACSDYFEQCFGFRFSSESDARSKFPCHYKNVNGYINPTAWTCAGFAAFAEWYIFSGGNVEETIVTSLVERDVPNTYDSLKDKLRPGDVLRYGTSSSPSQHSAIVISVDGNGVLVLDSNYEKLNKTGAKDYNYVAKHYIPFYNAGKTNGYSIVAISRCTKIVQ